MILVFRHGSADDPAEVATLLPWNVAEAAAAAAKALYPDEPGVEGLIFTLKDCATGELLPRNGLAPTSGSFELVETGGLV